MKEEAMVPPGNSSAVNGVSRWLAERFDPSLKCKRLGHKLVGQWRRGYQRADYFKDFRAVVVGVRQEREICQRCADGNTPWRETERRSIQSFRAPQSIWDAMDAGGSWSEWGRTVLTNADTSEGKEIPGGPDQ